MSQQKRSIKQTNLQTHTAAGHQLEHTEVFDDNLLPDAAEIERLQKLDPSILEWLKKRAEKEQDFRHDSFSKRAEIISLNERSNRTLNLFGLMAAFVIFLVGMLAGGYLILKDHSVTGSLFCGATLLSAAGLFINRQQKVREKNKQAQRA